MLRPNSVINKLLVKLMPLFKSEELYLKMRYFFETGTILHLNNPQTFCEKIQWLKLYYIKPHFTFLVDKYSVKKIVAEIIGERFIIPTLGVWNSPEEIDFSSLPNQFVLKATQGSGGKNIVICRDKSQLNKSRAVDILKSALQIDTFQFGLEWPYKNIEKKIIAEELLTSNGNKDLIDYKFYCFNGVPKLCQVISNRSTKETIDFFDMDWRRLEGLVGLNPEVTNSTFEIFRPHSFETMKECAVLLSKDFPFARIDFYDVNGKCYFGEFTFYPASGFGRFKPYEWNLIIGNWLTLPPKHVEKN